MSASMSMTAVLNVLQSRDLESRDLESRDLESRDRQGAVYHPRSLTVAALQVAALQQVNLTSPPADSHCAAAGSAQQANPAPISSAA